MITSPMARALQLARRAVPISSPNPPVGAVLVKHGTVLSEGHTQPPGREHAEKVALRQAGAGASGGTLYVTLEPCCHWGRTPPCTDAVIEAGLVKVHVAVLDPNPLVGGGGVRLLRQAGIEVTVGDGAAEAARLILPHTVYITRHRPLVTVVAEPRLAVGPELATEAGAVLRAHDGRLEVRWRDGNEATLDGSGDLARVLHELAGRGVSSVLVDDADLARRLIEGDLADRIVAAHGWPSPPGFAPVDRPGSDAVYLREELVQPLLEEPQP